MLSESFIPSKELFSEYFNKTKLTNIIASVFPKMDHVEQRMIPFYNQQDHENINLERKIWYFGLVISNVNVRTYS